MLLGFDRCIIFGYERIIGQNQSISVNLGKVAFPKMISISTESLKLEKDTENSGTNFSVDYRFYLKKENKYPPPHGLYIGPYYSLNSLIRNNVWSATGTTNNFIDTHSKFNINTVGFELGYQLILWKRMTIDLLLVGPGIGFYNFKTSFDSSLSAETKEELLDGLDQLLTQKFPGLNYVLSDEEIKGNGTFRVTGLGYRYLLHIGFNF